MDRSLVPLEARHRPRRHQRRGYGQAVIDALVNTCRAEGGTVLHQLHRAPRWAGAVLRATRICRYWQGSTAAKRSRSSGSDQARDSSTARSRSANRRWCHPRPPRSRTPRRRSSCPPEANPRPRPDSVSPASSASVRSAKTRRTVAWRSARSASTSSSVWTDVLGDAATGGRERCRTAGPAATTGRGCRGRPG